MTRLLLVLLLALPLSGCKKKDAAKDAPPAGDAGAGDKEKEHIRFRPEGGSSTVLGKSRDRALDIEIMNEMRQIKVALMTDYHDGKGPGTKDAWKMLLRDFKQLRGLLEKDELVAFNNVRIGDSGTVLLYEKRVVDHNDGIVLTADGTPHRMNKMQFDALKKP